MNRSAWGRAAAERVKIERPKPLTMPTDARCQHCGEPAHVLSINTAATHCIRCAVALALPVDPQSRY
jgi:ribosomal protein S27E